MPARNTIPVLSLHGPASPPPEPNERAGNDHQAGQKDHAGEKQLALLRFRQDDAAVRRILGPNGDEVFILRQPIDGVQEQVAIALQACPLVGGKGGIADDDEARALAGVARAAALRSAATPRESGPA